MLVVVAMSGGVDSAVAAGLLQAQGHQVVGVTLQLWPEHDAEHSVRHGGCCGLGAVRDARAAADRLGIAHYVFEMREAFERAVIAEFAAAYAGGRTPNPCIACNEHIKFHALLEKARLLGAQALATGHYARIVAGPDGRPRLARAADPLKDQSYVLYPLRRQDLDWVRFPLGDLRKAEVRQRARALGLAVADKRDSQEICFVGPQGHAAVVGEWEPHAMRPGPIVDTGGRVLGTHRGIAHYTVGQRRGLGLIGPRPFYVVAVDAPRNVVVVGCVTDLYAEGCSLPRPHWLVPEPPARGTAVLAKVRSGPARHPARIVALDGNGLQIAFEPPLRAVTPGQACVLYDGDEVLGGGEIGVVQPAAQSVQAELRTAIQSPLASS